MSKGRKVGKKKILWISDAVVHTGFATVADSVLQYLHKDWDVSVIGINYKGDPHDKPYRVYPAGLGGDVYGTRRLVPLFHQIQPDLIFILQDPWIIPMYLKEIVENKLDVPVIAYSPVDAPNIPDKFVEPIKEYLTHLITYTEFGKREYHLAGYNKEITVIPHGYNKDDFYPVSKEESSKFIKVENDSFVVGNVGRNQIRKRLDLSIEYFSEWVKDKPKNVMLYLHCALKDQGWDIIQLCKYYGVEDRLIITSPNLTSGAGIPYDRMKYVYRTFDIQINTAMGEGWSLPQMEGMAVGVPQIVPDFAGLGDWAREGARLVPVTSNFANTGGINTIGGIIDKKGFIDALEDFYTNKDLIQEYSDKALKLVSDPRYEWKNIASQFDSVFKKFV